MGAVALGPTGRTVHAPAGTVARPWLARLSAFAALGLFAGLHWGALIEPGRGGTMLLSLLCALAGAGALLAVPDRATDWQRRAMIAVVCLALLVLALLCAGVPLRMLGPHGVDELVDGMGEGIGTTPGITVPYRGVDEWVRIAILSGGTALLALAAVLAFWPRRGGGLGSPLPAAVALGALYAVPIIERGPDTPYFDGALFCILLAGLLWLERLRADQAGVGVVCVLLAAIVGALVGPHLDAPRPWFDYESFAEKLEPTKAEAFSWNHSYGPLHWPRDGREMLRVKAKHSAYWKATNLAEFDGVRWREGRASREQLSDADINRRWLQTISVIDRGLRSQQFVGAGVVQDILPRSSRLALPQPDGTFVTANKPLRPGDSYQALVYTPTPSDRQLRQAGTDYPAYTQDFRELRVPTTGLRTPTPDAVGAPPPGPSALVRFPAYGDDAPPGVVGPGRFGVQPIGDAVLAISPYARLWELTKSIRRTAGSPYDFAQKVRDRVQSGASYDESPPASGYPLASFLFDEKAGYCQQFSGVMALMLRMGGIPARVASGFSPGSYNSERKEYAVRDTDAHSWVEAYFPHLGWITFDPTPAASPATSQQGDAISGSGGAPGFSGLPAGLRSAGDRPFAAGDPGAKPAAETGGGGWQLPLALGLTLLGLGLVGLVLRRRRRTPSVAVEPELVELQRALRRSGRHPAPDVTLSRLEGLLGGGEAVAAYLRAVRDRRFGRHAEAPTRSQRRALRRALGAGLGARGTLRAYWALPPSRPPALPSARGVKRRLRRSYTET
jgi:transglutaminase-like putative cysteine protease